MRIYLIGYMGSGKSKTAEALSRILKYEFIDTDELIVLKEGRSVTDIFESNGEEYFRKVESEVLFSTAGRENVVVATGGGLPSSGNNMEWMNEHGITVYLEANPGLLFHRLAPSRIGRPLIEKLDDVELMEQITGHLARRTSYYKMSALTVNAADLNAKELAEKIKSTAGKKSAKPGSRAT